MGREERFGRIHIERLRTLRDTYTGTVNLDLSDIAVLDAAIVFLTTRLTEAAIDGCHHCYEKPGPCWWCGLYAPDDGRESA